MTNVELQLHGLFLCCFCSCFVYFILFCQIFITLTKHLIPRFIWPKVSGNFITWRAENCGVMWSTSWWPGSREKHAFLPSLLCTLVCLGDVTHKTTNQPKQNKTKKPSQVFSLLTFCRHTAVHINNLRDISKPNQHQPP